MTPLPVIQISAPTDPFRCVPYSAVMLARACVIRQANSRRTYEPGGVPAEVRESKCRDCELGRQVQARLDGRATDASPEASAANPPPVAVAQTSGPSPARGRTQEVAPVPAAKSAPVLRASTATALPSAKETTMAKCKFKGCNDAAARVRGTLPDPRLGDFCAVHRGKLRWSPLLAKEYGFDPSAIRYPSAGSSDTDRPAAPPAPTKPTAPATKVATPATPDVARVSIRITALEIEGENVSVDQLAALWVSAKRVLGGG